jgi:hypothetical protein
MSFWVRWWCFLRRALFYSQPPSLWGTLSCLLAQICMLFSFGVRIWHFLSITQLVHTILPTSECSAQHSTNQGTRNTIAKRPRYFKGVGNGSEPPPPPPIYTAIMATSFLRPLVFLSSVWQIEALPYFCYLVLTNTFINDLVSVQQCNQYHHQYHCFPFGDAKKMKVFLGSLIFFLPAISKILKAWQMI